MGVLSGVVPLMRCGRAQVHACVKEGTRRYTPYVYFRSFISPLAHLRSLDLGQLAGNI